MSAEKSRTPGSSGKAGARKPPVGRRFQKGQSGNPLGRRKSDLDVYVLGKSKNGKELADLLFDIARGKAIAEVPTSLGMVTIQPAFKDRTSAITELVRIARIPLTPLDSDDPGAAPSRALIGLTVEQLTALACAGEAKK